MEAEASKRWHQDYLAASRLFAARDCSNLSINALSHAPSRRPMRATGPGLVKIQKLCHGPATVQAGTPMTVKG